MWSLLLLRRKNLSRGEHTHSETKIDIDFRFAHPFLYSVVVCPYSPSLVCVLSKIQNYDFCNEHFVFFIIESGRSDGVRHIGLASRPYRERKLAS